MPDFGNCLRHVSVQLKLKEFKLISRYLPLQEAEHPAKQKRILVPDLEDNYEIVRRNNVGEKPMCKVVPEYFCAYGLYIIWRLIRLKWKFSSGRFVHFPTKWEDLKIFVELDSIRMFNLQRIVAGLFYYLFVFIFYLLVFISRVFINNRVDKIQIFIILCVMMHSTLTECVLTSF